MSTPIPSPILARMQVMFGAGATVEEVAEALDYELTGMEGEWLVGSAAVDAAHLKALKTHTAALGKKVDALFQLNQLKDVPEVAGALDLIAHEARSVIREARALEGEAGNGTGEPPSEPAVRKSKPGRRRGSPSGQSSPSVSAVSRQSQPSRKTREPATQEQGSPVSRKSPPTLSTSQPKSPPKLSPKASAPPPRPQAPPPLPAGFGDTPDAHVDALARELNTASPPPLPGAAADAPDASPSGVRELVAEPRGIPDGVKPSPSAVGADTMPSGTSASRPSPGRPSRNALTDQIAGVVDQISAIAQVDEREEDRPSALRNA